MNELKKIIDEYVGFHGPILLSVITILNLLNQKKFLISYLVFFVVNHYINKILKTVIREPRPSNSIQINDMDNNEGSKYGMPSRHTQSIFYSLTFLYLVKSDVYLLIAGLFIASIAIYQRWTYRRHTLEQLIAGSLIGTFFAYFAYYMTNLYLSAK